MVANLAAVSDSTVRKTGNPAETPLSVALSVLDSGKYVPRDGGPAAFARSARLIRVGRKCRGMHVTMLCTHRTEREAVSTAPAVAAPAVIDPDHTTDTNGGRVPTSGWA